MNGCEPLHSSDAKDVGAIGAAVRLLTWNINGLKKVAASYGGLKALLDQFEADVVEHDLARAQGYHCLFTHCRVRRKPSYSGVATFIRSESGLRTIASTTSLSDVTFFGSPGISARGLSPDRLKVIDSEGRVLVTDHGYFVLFNVYAPCISSGDEDDKTEERREFKRDFLGMLEARIFEVQDRGRAVILAGDLNACASQIDHGFTMTDAEFYASNWSRWIRGILGLDSSNPPRLFDCFRRIHPDRGNAFTCWNTVTGARENNYGTRIDYIIAGAAFAEKALQGCDIMPHFLGSDHCPVHAKFVVPSAVRCRADAPTGAANTGVFDHNEWPEHPPECSCFYGELAARQEKLAKYFKTNDPNSATRACLGGEGAASGVGVKAAGDERKKAMGAGRIGGEGEGSRQILSVGFTRARSCESVDRRETRNKSSIHVELVRNKRTRQSKLKFISAPTRALSEDYSEHRSFRTGHVDRVGEQQSRQSQGVHSKSDRDLGPINTKLEPHSGDVCSGSNSKGASAEAWKAIFGRGKSTPPCAHGEPSVQRTVLKLGQNYNRRFYTCARSAGNWPIDRNARCSFFQWRLDGVKGYKDRPQTNADAKRQRRLL